MQYFLPSVGMSDHTDHVGTLIFALNFNTDRWCVQTTLTQWGKIISADIIDRGNAIVWETASSHPEDVWNYICMNT